ncbi:MAG: serine/threonine-protein kinase [Spartobacteria bacterium]
MSFSIPLCMTAPVDSEIEASVIGGRYVIDRKLGSGGEGAVYLAYDQLLNRHVAIKSVHTGVDALTDAAGSLNEANRLASLQHPNIVTIFDFLPSHENVFVVMEFINGTSLDKLESPMDAAVFGQLARQSLEALGAAHSLGMVHRDIKSANIMVTWTETGDLRVKLLDFGLAKIQEAPSEQTLDHSGALTGSIYFLSPEQLHCQPIDHRADLYSLGCVFYRALTLRNPFDGAGVSAVISSHLEHAFTPLAEYRPDLPVELTAWVESLFAFSPDDRPSSAADALKALEGLKNKPPVQAAPRTKPVAAPVPVSKKTTRRFPVWIAVLAAVLVAGGVFAAMKFAGQDKKKPAVAEADDGREQFTAGERAAITRRDGKSATITGDIAKFDEEGSTRFLRFKGAEPGDVVLCFVDSDKNTFSTRLLKTYIGKRVTASGTVSKDGKRLLLEVPNMSQLREQVRQNPTDKSTTP